MAEFERRREAEGLLAGIGFHMVKCGDKFAIRNKAGKEVCSGSLESMCYTASFMANEAKINPRKYQELNKIENPNQMYQAGVAMGKKLNQGK